MEGPPPEATSEDLAAAEALIRDDFRRTLDELLRQRGGIRPEPSDDRAVFGLADAATRRYHAATASNPSLPRPSRVQLWQIRQRLYIIHGPLGPLGDLLAKDNVEDIHFNGPRAGYLVFGDHREELPARFASEEELTDLVRHYAEQAGKHFDPSNPVVTVTLRDGSRLNAVLPPISKPLVLTVRKQQVQRFMELGDLVAQEALPAPAVPLLEAAVLARLNVLISGATGSGKTTLARVLALMIPEGERTCVLETETELWLHELRERDTFSLEARDANVEGAGRITLRDLFQHAALRQRPERIIVGEVRGDEAMDMLHAMTSGHDGSLTTIHASSVATALSRLETLAMLTDANLSPRVVRQMVGAGVDLVIHLGGFRRPGGQVRRKVASMAFVDENREDPQGGVAVQEFCRYRVLEDDWEIGSEFGIFPPRKVEEKLLMAGLEPGELQVAGVPVVSPFLLAFLLSAVGAGICLVVAAGARWTGPRAWVGGWVVRLLAVERTRRALVQAGITGLSVTRWLGLRAGCGLIAAVLAYLAFGVVVLAAVGFMVAYHLLGLALELRRRRQRQMEWREALLEAVRYGATVMARGGSATDMITALARNGPASVRPLFSELAGASAGSGGGDSMPALVDQGRNRVADPLLDDVALALILHWQRGARLVSALEAIAEEWEENIRIQREAKAIRSGIETSVIILALLPAAFLGLLQLLAPTLLGPFHTAAGQVLLGIMVLWMVVGYRVLQRMSAPPREERLGLKEAAG